MKTPERAELIECCEYGFVEEDAWWDRDSASAQRQLGEAYALLRAGCDYKIAKDPPSGGDTWWVEITFKGFGYFDSGDGPEDRETETFYLPTMKRIRERGEGKDWY